MEKKKVVSGKVKDHVYFGLYKIVHDSNHPFFGIRSWFCGYIIAPKKFFCKELVTALDDIAEVTWPTAGGMHGIIEYRVGFDTAHYHNDHSIEEAMDILNKWIKECENTIF